MARVRRERWRRSMAHILVIDDDPRVLFSLSRVLRNAGHQVTGAANGNEGLRVLKGTTPDLIITDIVMPEKEGLELIQELRLQRIAVPVIAISGGGRIEGARYLELAQLLGADLTLAKPVTNAELLTAVTRILGPE